MEGHLLVPDGADPTGRIVAASRGDGHIGTIEVGPDGAFRFDNLLPGPWQILECEAGEIERVRAGRFREWLLAGEPIPWTLHIDEGATATVDVDSRGSVACRFEGELLVDAAPPVGWTWEVSGQGPRDRVFDADGRFAFQATEPGGCSIVFHPPQTPETQTTFRLETELHAGSNRWNEDLRTGTIEISDPTLDPMPTDPEDLRERLDHPRYALAWTGESGMTWHARVFGAAEHQVRILHAPVGRHRLTSEAPTPGANSAPSVEIEFSLEHGAVEAIDPQSDDGSD